VAASLIVSVDIDAKLTLSKSRHPIDTLQLFKLYEFLSMLSGMGLAQQTAREAFARTTLDRTFSL
jgi:hypothetical protein